MFAASAALLLPFFASAQKKPLDHSVYDGWKSIRSTSISHDGKWVLYVIAPQEGDATATIRNVADGHTITIARPGTIQFTNDSQHVVAAIIPPFADTRKARRDKAKPEDMPKNSLEIVDLTSGKTRVIEKVTSFQLAEEDSGYVLYKPEPPKETPKAADSVAPKKDEEEEDQRRRGAGGGVAAPAAAGTAKKAGDPYILLNLNSGKEERIEEVGTATFDKKGDILAYSVVTKDGKNDHIVYYRLPSSQRKTVITATGKFPRLTLSPEGDMLAFTTDKDDSKAKKPSLSLYLYTAAKDKTAQIGLDSLPKDWSINEGGSVEFSHNGKRLLYHTSRKPVPDPDPKPDDESVSVDVWNWHDARLQPQQLLEAKAERERGYLAVFDIASAKSVQLGDEHIPNPQIGDRGDANYAEGSDEHTYERENTWNPGYSDAYIIDVKTGKRTKIADHLSGESLLSTTARYAAIYNGQAKEWTALNLATGVKASLSQGIPVSIANELTDTPEFPPPYGIVGWTKDDAKAIVADRYDLWLCDPAGQTKPQRLTSGREYQTTYRPVRLDPEERSIDSSHLLLDAFNYDTKEDGLVSLDKGQLQHILKDKKAFGGYLKAKNADTLVFTRQDFVEYPDLWLTTTNFQHPTKISDANPQQAQYNWGTAELVRWTSLDGIPLQGILIKPENFQYGKKYPMITYFYERMSDDLYRYKAPAPSASTINWPLFASNGYCIFIPDIPYKTGYPGESAVNAILPGIESITSRGYIDTKHMGIQGQSWGGYQVAYLVTRTNMFACAEAGAPVGDMFSAYGGIRYGSGVVREMQYEHGQSRIGGTPWDSTLKYIENSPVFWADKVETPLMIMSNDKDGAVPHTQGIELFTALRRLDKPSWMVVYNEEDHNLVQRKNRKDLSIRLSQFFDHYLKGAPTPVWMSKGVPAIDKGRTMGTDFDTHEPAPPQIN